MAIKQQAFEARYQHLWQAFAKEVDVLESARTQLFSRQAPQHDLQQFAQQYRVICHLHALAVARHYSSYLSNELNTLVARGYQVLYRPKRGTALELVKFLLVDFPATVRAEWRVVLLAGLVFLLPTLFYFVAVMLHPALIYAAVPPESVEDIERMYNSVNNLRMKAMRGSSTDIEMFGFYIFNNIGVGFRTFATGLLAGVGSLFFLFFNGLLLGGVSAHVIHMGYADTFFSFVISHGSFELTAIVLSGAAGLKLGGALLFPGRYRRWDALRLACVPAARIMYGVITMLVIAAFLEGFWSSSSYVSNALKYGVGTGLWLLVYSWLFWSGRSRRPRDAA
jgi:uncharacterized membrane protein SpoIIM required for sporulation